MELLSAFNQPATIQRAFEQRPSAPQGCASIPKHKLCCETRTKQVLPGVSQPHWKLTVTFSCSQLNSNFAICCFYLWPKEAPAGKLATFSCCSQTHALRKPPSTPSHAGITHCCCGQKCLSAVVAFSKVDVHVLWKAQLLTDAELHTRQKMALLPHQLDNHNFLCFFCSHLRCSRVSLLILHQPCANNKQSGLGFPTTAQLPILLGFFHKIREVKGLGEGKSFMGNVIAIWKELKERSGPL